MKRKKKYYPILIRMDAEDIQKLRKEAELEDRSMAYIIRMIVRNYLEEPKLTMKVIERG